MPIDPAHPIYKLRRQLAAAITSAVGGSDVIGKAYGIRQPRMSELSRGIVQRCTMEWLIRRIHLMGGKVELRVELGDVRRAFWQERFRRQRAARTHRKEITAPADVP